MSKEALLQTVLPYPYIVGQDRLKLALELAYIAPRIGGVLISGKRGTAKSTTVRAFASMMYHDLPVTIPINATEDRVVGGWQIHALMQGQTREQEGLLKEAHQKLLYIDEVNLLDDHIINIILDVTATGKLVVQREGLNKQYDIQTTLVGTMNPEEGGLRPQLLDRFGLMVGVEAITDRPQRRKILEIVLAFDQALAQIKNGQPSTLIKQGHAQAAQRRKALEDARARFYDVKMQENIVESCVKLAEGFEVEGHRSDYLLALAACAHASRRGATLAELEDVKAVAELVLRHRQPGASQVDYALWDEVEEQKLAELLS
jgi:magnesium chelatase subunit I